MPLKIFEPKPSLPLPQVQSVLAIAAGKGGVGKSSVTVNLALALKRLGLSVGILDADVYGPSVRRMLPEDRLPSQKGNVISPALCHGIKMMSVAYLRKDNEAAAVRAPIANGIISQFIKNVDWGALDYLLIDFPPGTGDIQLTLSQQANLTGAVMVTTPQEVALMDVRKAMHLFNQVKIPIVGIVENMSYYLHEITGEKIYVFGKGGGERLAQETGVPLIGHIPLDPIVCAYGDTGRSLFDGKENTSTQAFLHSAENIIRQVNLLKYQRSESIESFDLQWKEMGSLQ